MYIFVIIFKNLWGRYIALLVWLPPMRIQTREHWTIDRTAWFIVIIADVPHRGTRGRISLPDNWFRLLLYLFQSDGNRLPRRNDISFSPPVTTYRVTRSGFHVTVTYLSFLYSRSKYNTCADGLNCPFIESKRSLLNAVCVKNDFETPAVKEQTIK